MTGAPEVVAGWPLAASLAVVLTASGVRAGRRRSALNEALHELRRPLQAVALATVREPAGAACLVSSLRLAAFAVERLDREINGRGSSAAPEAIPMRPLLESAIGRWRGRVGLVDGSLTLRWRAGGAVVDGEPAALAQALDNLLVNAIEHGGPSIVVDARSRGGKLQIAVADSGHGSRPQPGHERPAEVIGRLAGRRRRGHGLTVVRRVAVAHRGRFALRRSERGSLALLELPLSGGGHELAA